MCVSINGPGDLETGMRVASKVENLHSEFGHAFGFSSHSLCTRRTDRQTDRQTKTKLIAPSLRAGA